MKIDWKKSLGTIRVLGPDTPNFNKAVKEIWDYIEHFEKHKRDWPADLHEQYLKVLDERDAMQDEIDYLLEKLND